MIIIKNIKYIILILFFLLIISLGLFIIYNLYIQYNSNDSKNSKNSKKNIINEHFDCSLNLTDIDSRHINDYMKFNNTKSRCGICNRSMLYVNIVSTCPTDANGSLLSTCKQSATISSSHGIPIIYSNEVNSDGITQFFCPSEQVHDIVT